MPTKQPRINVVLREPVYQAVETLAESKGLSLSSQVEQLIVDALETIEDMELAKIADERLSHPGRIKWIPHSDFWKSARKKHKV